MTPSDIPGLLNLLADLWPDTRLNVPDDEDGMRRFRRNWCDLFGTMTAEDATAVIRSFALRGDRFPPTPGQIRAELIPKHLR